MSRSVGKLEERGLIAPVQGRFVGRTKPYEITDKGRDLYAQLREIALAREDQLLAALTEEERRLLIELMRKVMTRIGDL